MGWWTAARSSACAPSPAIPRSCPRRRSRAISDEMFSIGVVLLVLERTDSAALAGLTVAAVSLPSLVDRAAARRLARPHRPSPLADGRRPAADRDRAGLALIAMVGNAPDWTVPLVVLLAGLTYPLSYGGFTSFIPVLVPDELLAVGERVRGDELQPRARARAGAGGHARGALRPGVVAGHRGGAGARGARADRAPARARPAAAAAATRSLLSVAAEGLRQVAVVPELRGDHRRAARSASAASAC